MQFIIGKSLDYSSLYTNLFGDGLNLGGVLACMLAYSILYIPIAWYIERIFPGEYGAPLPLYFPFMVIFKLDQKMFAFKRISKWDHI